MRVWRCHYGDPSGVECWLEFPYTEGEVWWPPVTVTLERKVPGSDTLFELALLEQLLVSK